VPTYAYACTTCGHEFDVVQSITDPALQTCEECGGPLRKVFHPVGVTFKGSGFYRTDSRAGGGAASGTDTKGAGGSADAAGSGKTGAAAGSSDGAGSGGAGKKEGPGGKKGSSSTGSSPSSSGSSSGGSSSSS
jgi:putative FmdB family regulatory protein